MFEDSTIVWIPVPRERLLDAYAALATMQPGAPVYFANPQRSNAPPYVLTEPVTSHVGGQERGSDDPLPPDEKPLVRKPPKGVRKSTWGYVSLRMVNRAKREIKHLRQPFTVNDLQRAMDSGRTSADNALRALIKEGWARRAGWDEGKAKLYEYVPAPEAPTVKQDDPPEVTGRGSVTGNGGPVAGTGREALRGSVGHLITQLRKQGWTVKKTSKSHYKAVKDRNIVILSSTPSDTRALQNMVSQLRKAGAQL